MSTASADCSPSEARDLLVDLVSIPSPSGEEDDAARRLVDFLESHGRTAWRDGVGNVRAPADDGVLLTSHLDTVPGTIPVRTDIVDGKPVLWGRGSVDATGSLAAMAVAAVETGASFAGVVQEETDSAGARHLIDVRDAPDAVLNGEPSGWDATAVGYRGLLAGEYAVRTTAAHSSRPEPNGVQHAIEWWQDIEAAVGGRDGQDIEAAVGGRDGQDIEAAVPGFGGSDGTATADAPATPESVFESVTVTPLSIDGGPTGDGLAVEATVTFELRFPPSTDAATLCSAVESATEQGTIEWAESIPPLVASPRTPVARALRASIRAEGGDPRLLRKTGTCDANIYASAWDCPTAVYGPGDSSLDHTPDERLPLPAFDRSIDVLVRAVDRLLTDDGGGEPS